MNVFTISFKTRRALAAISALSALAAVSAQAEDVYLRVGLSPAMGLANQALGGTSTTEADGSRTDDLTYSSLGKGVGIDAAVGVGLAKHFAAELGLGYLFGLSTTQTTIDNTGAGQKSTSTAISGRMFRITPAVVVRGPLGPTIVYSRVGLVLGIAAMNVAETTTSPGHAKELDTTYDGGIAIGMTAAVGADYKVADRISLFGEVNFTSLSYTPTHSLVTTNTVDGANKLPDMKTNQRETNYVSSQSIPAKTSVNSDPSKPSQQLATISAPFGSLGLQVGVKFGF